MENILIAVIFLAVGTYLTRFIPFYLSAKRQEAPHQPREIFQKIFIYIGPSLIASLVVISLSPLTPKIILGDFFRLVLGFIAITIAHIIWRNPGISVLLGIAAYAIF